jgi:hypothetical protein
MGDAVLHSPLVGGPGLGGLESLDEPLLLPDEKCECWQPTTKALCTISLELLSSALNVCG